MARTLLLLSFAGVAAERPGAGGAAPLARRSKYSSFSAWRHRSSRTSSRGSGRRMGQAIAKDVLVVVDPASTGAMLELEANPPKLRDVCVWSDASGEEMKTHTPHAAKDITFVAVLEEGGLAIEKLAALV